jgi:hypothetical protein
MCRVLVSFFFVSFQLIEKDPNEAVPLFWAAINSGDRIESALKDMANVLKQANRAEEAIEAIRSFRDRCTCEAQESLDNILLDLYKVFSPSFTKIIFEAWLWDPFKSAPSNMNGPSVNNQLSHEIWMKMPPVQLSEPIIFMLNQKCGRTEEQIEMLTMKMRIVDEDLASGRWKAKLSKSQGRKVYLSLRDEKARYLRIFLLQSGF